MDLTWFRLETPGVVGIYTFPCNSLVSYLKTKTETFEKAVYCLCTVIPFM